MFTVQGCSTIDYTVHLYITHIISVPHKLHTLYIHCMYHCTQTPKAPIGKCLLGFALTTHQSQWMYLEWRQYEMHTCMNAGLVYRMCKGSVISGYDLSSVELFDPVMQSATPLFYVAMATLEYSPQTNLTFITSPQWLNWCPLGISSLTHQELTWGKLQWCHAGMKGRERAGRRREDVGGWGKSGRGGKDE